MIFKELEELKKELDKWQRLNKDVDELTEFLQSIDSQEDKQLVEEQLSETERSFKHFERETLFSGEYDENNAVLSLHAGAGGVDAQDWTEMLLRMYLRFAEKKNWSMVILHQTKGAEAGIKSATIEISGKLAYGHLRAEAGVHRLVRLSPFNSDNLRQTSFALVEVIPLIEKAKEVDIDQKDLKIDTFRSSGAGGQSVNTTDSAVRVTHLPTNTVVTCQNQRSQLQNKEKALEILHSRLTVLKKREEEEENAKMRGETKSAEWGSQIRSYVLHPYKLVKDHRTKIESKDPEGVLDGDIGEFIEGFLRNYTGSNRL